MPTRAFNAVEDFCEDGGQAQGTFELCTATVDGDMRISLQVRLSSLTRVLGGAISCVVRPNQNFRADLQT